MTPEQLDQLLNQTFYSWDVTSLLSGVVSYLEFSEGNLAWQRRRELERAHKEAADLEVKDENPSIVGQMRSQIIENAEYRFDALLSQSVRYGSLVAYVTAMEWCARTFESLLTAPLPKKPQGKNGAVHVLEHIDTLVGKRLAREIQTLAYIVTIRNCVVHNAGVIEGDKYEVSIREAISNVDGFSTTRDHFIGEAVHIEAGVIDAIAKRALEWVPTLDEQCRQQGIFQKA